MVRYYIATLILILMSTVVVASWETIGIYEEGNDLILPILENMKVPKMLFFLIITSLLIFIFIRQPKFESVAIVSLFLIFLIVLPPPSAEPPSADKPMPWTDGNYTAEPEETVYGIPNLGAKLSPKYPLAGWILIALAIFIVLGYSKKIELINVVIAMAILIITLLLFPNLGEKIFPAQPIVGWSIVGAGLIMIIYLYKKSMKVRERLIQ